MQENNRLTSRQSSVDSVNSEQNHDMNIFDCIESWKDNYLISPSTNQIDHSAIIYARIFYPINLSTVIN